jgi:hypothetical protein
MGWPDDGGRGQDLGDQPLPVPTGRADEAMAQVRSLINRIDELIVARVGECGGRLHMWTGPARDGWDLDFNLTQVELQGLIDRLQPFAADVEDLLDVLGDHNRRVEEQALTDGVGGGGVGGGGVGGGGSGSW